jgi:adenosylhomocysteine nucleosidase
MIALLFALRNELIDLEHSLAVRKKEKRGPFTWYLGETERSPFVLIRTGIGSQKAAEACEALLRTEAPRLVVSSGYAGGISGEVRKGDVILGRRIVELRAGANRATPWEAGDAFESDAALVRRCREIAAGLGLKALEGTVATSPRLLTTPAEKAELGRFGAFLSVDLETAAVARACRAKEIPFLSLRGISDERDVPLPVMDYGSSPRDRLFLKSVPCGIIQTDETEAVRSLRKNCRTARAAYSRILFQMLGEGLFPK